MTCPHCEIGRFERESIDTANLFYHSGVLLTKQQIRLVAQLLSKSGVHRTESLVNAIWYDQPNGEPEYAENIIKVHISKIRKKVAAVKMPFRIVPVWGIGYFAETSKEEEQTEGKVLRGVFTSLALALLTFYPVASLIS